MKVAIIGGGAAGFFAAIQAKHDFPHAQVTIFEKSTKLLSKVKVSGGGRCNVTHDCHSVSELVKNYPRGAKYLKKAFQEFNVSDTIHWFNRRGVRLKVESDGRIFPITDNSMTIVSALLGEANKLGVQIRTQHPITSLIIENQYFTLFTNNSDNGITADKVVVAAGGSPKLSGLDWLIKLGLQVSPPVPSIFTFNIPNADITSLKGVTMPEVMVKVQGSKFKFIGPILITHWGLSGPVILKTSAWAARQLHEQHYDFVIHLNWINHSEDVVRQQFQEMKIDSSKKQLANKPLFNTPSRLWEYFINRAGLRDDITYGEIGNKGINKFIDVLLNDQYHVIGKTTFKDEFVTCGGILLSEINIRSMESKKVKGLYFAGEILDIDGITGGFNFQAAWTTGFIAGQLKDIN